MGVAEWFSTFSTNIKIRDHGTIDTRYKAIVKRLNLDFWGSSSETVRGLYVGSYGRNTAGELFSDLDMTFELPASLYGQYDGHTWNGQSALLQAVSRSIRTTYSSSCIGADGQVVSVQFTDGINYEVVPVFENQIGSYTYPDSNAGGSWKTTNPKPEIDAIRDRNAVCNGNLVLLARMMRSWKLHWAVPIGGLLIDTLAYQFIENWPYRDKSYLYHDYMCRDFFAWVADQSDDQEYWRHRAAVNMFIRRESFSTKPSGATISRSRRSTAKPVAMSGRPNRSGGRFLDQSSPPNAPEPARDILEAQLRECYGRVVYSHKTHEKCADLMLSRLARIKLAQIILSAATTVGFFVAIFGKGPIAAILGLIASMILLALNAYTKDYDLGELAQKHRQAGVELWGIRESYLSLITDIRAKRGNLESLTRQRDTIQVKLQAIYGGSPSTNYSAYKKAQDALQRSGDMTFSDEEIDAFLPKALKKVDRYAYLGTRNPL